METLGAGTHAPIGPHWSSCCPHNPPRRLYSVFSTVSVMYLPCCFLLVIGSCCLFLIFKMFL